MAETLFVYRNRQEPVMPSAAQQSVPAWLVFSMYFIVIPISLIFHTEKNNGTLMRLRSINIPGAHLVSGKIVAYYLVSMVQVVTMLCVGRYLVPLLGGDIIRFGDSPMGLFAIATCVGLNAISYGLMISALSKNTQVAGSLGVILVIIFAAIGGIMVPKFVMPAYLQRLSVLSPVMGVSRFPPRHHAQERDAPGHLAKRPPPGHRRRDACRGRRSREKII